MEFSTLITSAREGDAVILNQLLDAYRNYLRVLAQTWLPRSIAPHADESDLIQETLLKAHKGFPQFRGTTEAELVVWLRKILSRTVIDFVRKQGRAINEVSLNQEIARSGDHFRALLANSGTSPSQEAGRRELGVILADALANLPERQRQVIVLRNLREMDWKDVSEEMDRTISSVRAMWIRALSNLRTELEEIFG